MSNTKGAADKKKKTDIETIDFVNTTPKGEKKDTSQPLLKAYYPKAVESAWYDWWNECGFFKANNADNSRENFVVMLPPPNVTGSLHLGHALTGSIQDSIVRYQRMSGKNCLYLPGIDHAGIATQVVVEKKLFKETKQTRHDLGREKFIDKVWEWKKQYGARINTQLHRLGSSLDWSREVFTMDEPRTKAVTAAFVRMFEKGYIFRDTRLVNWDCTLNTAISNIEVDYLELDKPLRMGVPGHAKKYDFGYLWSFSYKIDGTEDEIIVSTTRPETMLGDTAVAVHPEDERYKKYHGKFVVHPFNGRKIPIITDSILVDPKFGTGAVKITPAHDYNDFECGKRHKLQFINIFNDDGTLNEHGAPFAGMKRFDARDAVVKAMEEKKILKDRVPNKMSLAICSRSNDVIEPMIKPQWFVNCSNLAQRALEETRNGNLKINPESEEKNWRRWLENIQPWCISRQLWWGHRIPAYQAIIVNAEGKEELKSDWIVATSVETAKVEASKRYQVSLDNVKELKQDDDVLDTWFSSGLFPFSTLGWPNEDSLDFKAFYPGSLLETGQDILFFWVARMVMMGLALTDQVPFKEVFLHSMVRDKFGQKMSKGLGNVIDPIDCIEGISLEDLHKGLQSGNLPESELEKAITGQKKQFPDGIPECGTDALRFTLLNYCIEGRDINLDIMRVFGYRTFCNKLWNATKFGLMNIEGLSLQSDQQVPDVSAADLGGKWILSRLNFAIKECHESFKKYDFNRYTEAIYNFFLKEFCDIYLEMIKPVMSSSDESKKNLTRHILYTCLEQGLRLSHPAMPFVTEELWQHLPFRNLLPQERKSIMINPYPLPQSNWDNSDAERDVNILMDMVHAIRSIKSSYNLTNKDKPAVYLKCSSNSQGRVVANNHSADIASLSISGNIVVLGDNEAVPDGCAVQIVNESTELYVLLKGMIDFAGEVEKLKKKKDQLEKLNTALLQKVSAAGYAEKVPQKVQDENNTKLEQYKQELEKLTEAISGLAKMLNQ